MDTDHDAYKNLQVGMYTCCNAHTLTVQYISSSILQYHWFRQHTVQYNF